MIRPVELYLKDLLFEYDCVTIPGVGGFVLQSQPARISKGNNRIYPPSRQPMFNSLLSHDDGLLISCLAAKEKISYHDAASVVSQFGESCKRKLASGETLKLDEIGEFSSGPDQTIRFEPVPRMNFNPHVFGMEPVSIYPKTRQDNVERLAKKPEDRKKRSEKAKRSPAVAWTTGISLPVIIFLLYGIFFPASFHHIYTNYSGIFPGSIQKELNREPEVKMVEATENRQEAPITVLVESEPIIPETPVLNEDIKAVEFVPASPKYYIIGGCFESRENASKFMNELIRKGFEAEEAGATKKGHIRISYGSFAEKPEALSYLQKIRNEENDAAWLLKY